ncbi:uncharacterized protein LAESUDRAFT_756708 [Laetiporus sulphureus 93-53]|uniref:Uncharacterized protein n=1 Tax=Laetiporus sulphureus 93-53 TaxID=1314785 RepID=A0A165G3W7_9APHY|nr:uncharacterized protein LAESUDRAFT_756708 [Laetiporus sulphureus 93-53]KZT09793.1 hypothetical protein LAESUDRAFT_756708 [Laetiporus sulphureus 93-53]
MLQDKTRDEASRAPHPVTTIIFPRSQHELRHSFDSSFPPSISLCSLISHMDNLPPGSFFALPGALAEPSGLTAVPLLLPSLQLNSGAFQFEEEMILPGVDDVLPTTSDLHMIDPSDIIPPPLRCPRVPRIVPASDRCTWSTSCPTASPSNQPDASTDARRDNGISSAPVTLAWASHHCSVKPAEVRPSKRAQKGKLWAPATVPSFPLAVIPHSSPRPGDLSPPSPPGRGLSQY